MSVNYTVRKVGEVTVLDLDGRISRGDAQAFGPDGGRGLHQVVRDIVEEGSRKVLLNLRHVTYVDSFGLGELVACMTTLHNHEGEFRVCNATARVAELLRMTHLSAVLHCEEDEVTGLKSFLESARMTAA